MDSMMNRWIDAKTYIPEDHVRVLAVKQLKDGRRELCLAYCICEWTHHDVATGEDVIAPYWVCGGNNNIIYWMPLPSIPEV
jgi:hypothetical protein